MRSSASPTFAFFQNAEVEPRAATGSQQCRHPGFVHPNADAIAGDARLRDLEKCAANPVTIADARGIVGHSCDGEILAELSVNQVSPLQLLLPIAIRFDLIDEDGSLLTTVAGQVPLTVSLEI